MQDEGCICAGRHNLVSLQRTCARTFKPLSVTPTANTARNDIFEGNVLRIIFPETRYACLCFSNSLNPDTFGAWTELVMTETTFSQAHAYDWAYRYAVAARARRCFTCCRETFRSRGDSSPQAHMPSKPLAVRPVNTGLAASPCFWKMILPLDSSKRSCR